MSSSTTTHGLPNPDDDGATCPHATRLGEFLREQLPPDEAARYLLHLDECERCQAAADAALSRQRWSENLCWFPEDHAVSTIPVTPGQAQVSSATQLATSTNASEEIRGTFPGSVRLLADRFELRRTVGMGGCGAVYEAWDRQLQRVVAVKVPHWSLFEKPSVRQRFAKEARAAARLSHPNVVPVHEACVGASGDCYLVSEFVPGPSLDEWLARQSGLVDIRQAARIVAEIAAGVDAAHAAGVIHRDLKPSNVLLAPVDHGELPFVPRVTDFGIARLSEEATVTTTEGRVFGSLPYMSPEQASAARDVGPSSDVYSLGVMLYELLTGELPITAETVPALLSAIPVQVVVPPRRKRPEVPADLEAVCLKCLEKRSKDRYRTAGELAVDLRRFLAGEAVTARLPGRWERLQRWARRNPTTASVLATLAVAVLVVVGVLVDANRKQSQYIQQLETSDRERTSANTQLATSNAQLTQALIAAGQARRQAETQRRKLQENLYVSEFQQAMQAWENQDLALVERTLNRLDQPEFAPFRGIECDWLRAKLYRPRRELMKLPRAVYTLAFTADGTALAAAGRDAIVKLVRYADGTPIAEWETGQKEVNGLAFVDEDKKLWTSGDDGSLVQWDVATKRELVRVPGHAPEQAHDLLVVPQQNLLLSMGTDGRVLLWDPLTGESRGELAGNGNTVIATALHADGRQLYSVTRDMIWRWDLTNRTLVSTWPLTDRPLAMLLSRDGRWLLSSTALYRLEIRDASTGTIINSTQLSDHVRRMIQNPDSDEVFAVDDRGTWQEIPLPKADEDFSREPQLRTIDRHFDGRSHHVILSPDNRDLVSTCRDGRVLSWSIAGVSPHVETGRQIRNARSLRFTPDDRAMVFTDGRSLRHLDLNALRESVLFEFTPRTSDIFCALPDESFLTGELDVENRGWLVHRHANGREISEIALSPAGGIAEIRFDQVLGLILVEKELDSAPAWRFLTLQPLQELPPLRLKGNSYPSALSSASGRFALNDRHALAVRDLTTRDIIWRQRLPDSVESLAASPDGRFIASASADRVIRVWDTQTGNLVSEMTGHRFRITNMVFAADGKTLFSGEDGGTAVSEVRVWCVPTGDLLGILFSRRDSGVLAILTSRSNDRLLIHHKYDRLQIIPLKPSAVR